MSRIQDWVMALQEPPDYEMPPDIIDPDIPTIFMTDQADSNDEPPF